MAGDAAMDRIDTSVPHSARIWNYWLGGKDNYPVDREAGDQVAGDFPGIVDVARASRFPRPFGPVPGRGGGHPPVPGHGHGPADGGQHP